MIVNRITEQDLPRLAELYEFLLGRHLDREAMASTFAKIRESGDYYLFGARSEDGILVGTVMAVACDDCATEGRPFMVMENLVVDPGWHRKGVGSMLVRAVESAARERNCIFLQFCSSSFRTEAHALYRESGYDPDAVRGFRKYFASKT